MAKAGVTVEAREAATRIVDDLVYHAQLRQPHDRWHGRRDGAADVVLREGETAATRWGEALELELFKQGADKPKKEVPTLRDFAPRFVDGYARANRQKPSGIAGKETILRIHLVPQLGSKKLAAITTEEVQRLKSRLN
jgi:hypothetical protein